MPKTVTGIYVYPQYVHGIRQLVGEIVLPQSNGELHTVRYEGPFRRQEKAIATLDSFRVSCYVGDTDYAAGTSAGHRIWGCTSGYRNVHAIDGADHARAMASTLGKVERGISKLNAEKGYLADDDFSGFLLRHVEILKIDEIHVRNFRLAMERSDQRHRRVDGAALQSYVLTVQELISRGNCHELNENR